MPNGPEYVEATLTKIERISTAIGALAGGEEEWGAEVQGRLSAVAELLQGTTDRFFLKTRVCLPFARKCEQAADGLQALVADGEPGQLEAGLAALRGELDRRLGACLEDSGLDIDALRIVSEGVNSLRSPERSSIVVTHYQRLLDYIVPDRVHVLSDGRIAASGDADLARKLEDQGYAWLEEGGIQPIGRKNAPSPSASEAAGA